MAIDKITTPAIADGAVSADTLTSTVITGQTAETSIATDDLILLSDTSASGALKKMTRANFVSGLSSSQAIVYAQSNSGTSCPNDTSTKIELENEILDTASLMASSRFTVTADYQGKYLTIFQMSFNHTATEKYLVAQIRKNGSEIVYGQFWSGRGSNHTAMARTSIIVDLTTNDYLEFYGQQNSGGTKTSNGGTATNVQIFKIN